MQATTCLTPPKIADQIKAALNELGDTLSEQGDHVEALISKHPIATMASTLALGIVIGNDEETLR